MFFFGIIKELRRIALAIERLRNPVYDFIIIGEDMNINPGQSTTLTAVPQDASGVQTTLPSGDVPNWSASDTSQITATPSADGLSLTVGVNSTATPGDIIFTITDALITAAKGTFTLSVQPIAGGPKPVASFSVTASTPA